MSNLLIIGGSRGLGLALSIGLPRSGDSLWLVSRSRPPSLDRVDGVRRVWIRADLAEPASYADDLVKGISGQQLDLLVYCAGVWEAQGFSSASLLEIQSIINVNLVSLLVSVKCLRGQLVASPSARVVLIGSTSGLENSGSRSAAYASTKFGVRGAAYSLREWLRADRIPVTCISPGSIASDVALEDGHAEALAKHGLSRIPVRDLIRAIDMIRELSPASCVKEIIMPAILDEDS